MIAAHVRGVLDCTPGGMESRGKRRKMVTSRRKKIVDDDDDVGDRNTLIQEEVASSNPDRSHL